MVVDHNHDFIFFFKQMTDIFSYHSAVLCFFLIFQVVVALLSDNFESDERSHDLLLYTMDSLGKDFVIVVIGDSLDWENTNLGMRIGKQEVRDDSSQN